MATLGSLLINVGVRLDGALKVEQKIKRMKRDTRKMGDAAERGTGRFRRAFVRMRVTVERVATRVGNKIGSLVKRAGGLPGVAAAGTAALLASVAGVVRFASKQAAAIDATVKLSTALGLSVEELQRLQFAAGQSGLGAAALTTGLTKLNKNLLDVKQGGGAEAARALEKLGINIADLDGLSRTQTLGLFGDRLNEIEDPATRSAVAAQLFGMRAGPQMASLLAEGTKGITKLTEGARGVFSREDADRAVFFQDRLGEVKREVGAVATELFLYLIPAANRIIVNVRDWIRENETLLTQAVPAFLHEVATAAEDTAAAIDLMLVPLEPLNALLEAVGFSGETASIGLSQFTGGLLRSLLPLQQTAQKINDINHALVAMGVLSGDSAVAGLSTSPAFASLQNHINAAIASVPVRMGVTTVAPRAKRPRRGRGGGGRRSAGRGGTTARKKAAAAAAPPGVTVSEAISALLGGDGDVLTDRLKGMADATPRTSDIKPTVAIDFFNFNVEQHITSSDPKAAGDESARAIRQVFKTATAQAAQSLASNVVR